MSPKLLIVDDDPEITSALVRGLVLHGYDAHPENRANRALERLKTEDFSGAIIDVMLGADSGIDLVRQARESGLTLPILMLSALSEVDQRAAGLEAGADDYIVKPFDFDELVARLRVQERRSSIAWPEPARLNIASRILEGSSGSVTLTEREYDLLEFLIDHAGTPLTRGAIFDMLWSGDGSNNENVVNVYVGYLRKKLSDLDFGFEIKTLRNQGFCLTGRIPTKYED